MKRHILGPVKIGSKQTERFLTRSELLFELNSDEYVDVNEGSSLLVVVDFQCTTRARKLKKIQKKKIRREAGPDILMVVGWLMGGYSITVKTLTFYNTRR